MLNHGNRQVDILFEEQLALDEQWALSEPATAHMTVRNLKATSFSKIHCFVSATEVDVQAVFEDLQQRKIEFQVKHKFALISRPMFTPAPPQKGPFCLRFLAMDTFHLLPNYADVSVVMDGALLPISAFVLPKSVSPFSSTRVGGSILLASLALYRDTSNHGAALSKVSTSCIVDQDLWMELVGLPKPVELSELNSGDMLTGDFTIKSPLGQLGFGNYQCGLGDNGMYFRLKNVTQDLEAWWRSPVRGVMRHVRNYNRKAEHWEFNAVVKTDSAGQSDFEGAWTNE